MKTNVVKEFHNQMPYNKMVQFMNDNGITVMQAVIANEADNQWPLGHEQTEEEFEEICQEVYNNYLEHALEPDIDIWHLVDEALTKRGYKEEL